MGRQSREHRHRGVHVRLTERDALLMEALNRFRLARTSELASVAFVDAGPKTAALRLRRLFDAGYLDVTCRDRSDENVYSLGPSGRRWIAAHGSPVGRVPRGGWTHHLAIVRTWSRIANALGRIEGMSLQLARADWELREEFGVNGLRVVPDLFLQVRFGPTSGPVREAALAVEVDLGTESPAVLNRKIRAYDELVASEHGLFGHGHVVLLIALENSARIDAISRLLGQKYHGPSFLWSTSAAMDAAIEAVVDGLRHGVQAPVTTSRYGNVR